MEAQRVWVTICANILFMFVVTGIVDIFLYREGVTTITAFLRVNPYWFWVPLILNDVFWVILAIHIYVR